MCRFCSLVAGDFLVKFKIVRYLNDRIIMDKVHCVVGKSDLLLFVALFVFINRMGAFV